MGTSTFRQTVAEVAARAKERLPQETNGRVESAVKLVLGHDIEPQEDGSILVGSSSDPLKQYRLEGHTCECQDFTRGQAPGGWCQHRIAAGIQKRVQELLPPLPEVVEVPCDPKAPAPLPEAPASVNVRLTISGREVQWTLRDSDEARLAERLAALLERYPASPPATPVADTTPQCPQHGAMRTGKRGWFCPRKLDDGSWCKGK